jgi:TM2 domain-containing membrane protein YozV
MAEKEQQSKMMMALVCWLLGSFGIHRMMMGYKNWWYMILATAFCGVGIFWSLYDLIMILTGSMKMEDGRDLK